MLLFLDTEYTGLGQSDPKLISLALVPEDGKNPFYAEIKIGDGWSKHDCTEFVLAEVLPILKGGKYSMTRNAFKETLLEWLTSMPRSIQVACDSETDFRFLKQVIGSNWPEKLDKHYFDLRPLIDTTVYDQAVQNYYDVDNPPHSALADAQSYQRGWQMWMSVKNKSE